MIFDNYAVRDDVRAVSVLWSYDCAPVAPNVTSARMWLVFQDDQGQVLRVRVAVIRVRPRVAIRLANYDRFSAVVFRLVCVAIRE